MLWFAGKPSYAHQGWLTTDHKYFLLDDETDELDGYPADMGFAALKELSVEIFDLTDLDAPFLIGYDPKGYGELPASSLSISYCQMVLSRTHRFLISYRGLQPQHLHARRARHPRRLRARHPVRGPERRPFRPPAQAGLLRHGPAYRGQRGRAGVH